MPNPGPPPCTKFLQFNFNFSKLIIDAVLLPGFELDHPQKVVPPEPRQGAPQLAPLPSGCKKVVWVEDWHGGRGLNSNIHNTIFIIANLKMGFQCVYVFLL